MLILLCWADRREQALLLFSSPSLHNFAKLGVCLEVPVLNHIFFCCVSDYFSVDRFSTIGIQLILSFLSIGFVFVCKSQAEEHK